MKDYVSMLLNKARDSFDPGPYRTSNMRIIDVDFIGTVDESAAAAETDLTAANARYSPDLANNFGIADSTADPNIAYLITHMSIEVALASSFDPADVQLVADALSVKHVSQGTSADRFLRAAHLLRTVQSSSGYGYSAGDLYAASVLPGVLKPTELRNPFPVLMWQDTFALVQSAVIDGVPADFPFRIRTRGVAVTKTTFEQNGANAVFTSFFQNSGCKSG